MVDTCPVVKVVADNEDGYTEINQSDFNEKDHKLYVDAKKAAPKKKAQKPE